MQLRRLDVTNIRSYEGGRIDFPSGTTLIVGDVGAGKTSLLYAIEMALFGTAEVDAAYLVRHGALHAEVAVRFEDGEHRYDIARRFRRVRRKGRESFETERITFREDGAPTSYSATEIRQRVIELLGFPDNPNPQAHSDLWRWAIYVPQERMREILSARPQERLETVRKALGVERYRIAAENAQVLAGDLRTEANHRREEADRMGHFDVEFAEARREADRLRAERVSLEASIARHAEGTATARARSEALEEVARRGEADARELASLSREQLTDERALAELDRRRAERDTESERRKREVEAARSEATRLPPLREALATSERAAAECRVAVDRVEEAARALAVATAERAAAERRLAELGERSGAVVSARETTRTELDHAVSEGPAHEPPAPTPLGVAELESALASARTVERAAIERSARSRTALSEIGELLGAGVCPRCHQAVRPEEFAPHRSEAAEELQRAEKEQAAASRAREETEAAIKSRERFERAHERWAELERRRTALRAELERRDIELRTLEAARREATDHLEQLRARIESLGPREEEGRALRADLASREAEVVQRRREVERYALAEERARSSDLALSALRAEQERAGRDRAELTRRLGERAARIEALRLSAEAATQSRAELDAARSELRRAEEALAGERAALVRTDTRLDAEVRREATAEKGRSERARLIARADELKRKVEWIAGPFRLHVLTMEEELLAHAQVAFDRNFARYFAALVDDPALVARTDAGFTPDVTIDGEATPAEALSGGERTALALAFRLALASVVRSLGAVRLESLLLDEPTDGFSAEQVVRMGELLDELALPQVVIVSHENELAAVADRTVRVVKAGGSTTIESEGRPAEGEPGAAEPAPPATPRPRRRRTTL
jgi:DNA repair protein SbcC/Rad50